MNLLLLTCSRTDPSSRFRVWQFAQPLRDLGHSVTVRVPFPNHYWQSSFRLRELRYLHTLTARFFQILTALYNLRDAKRYDVIFMNRQLVPPPKLTSVEPWLAKRNCRLIFDFDDAIHVGKHERKLRTILPHFACITAGNEYLASFARQTNSRVEIWPTVVDTKRFQPRLERKPGPVRIGWSGSRWTLKDHFPLLERVLRELAKNEQYELLVVANAPPSASWDGVNMRFSLWSPDTEVHHLQDMDIGLMPLPDKPFERGKCGFKAISYMACATPAVVSPVGASADIVVHGETGFHCRSDADWIQCLRLLCRDEKLRRRLGEAGRARVEKHYSVDFLLPRMLQVFGEVSRLQPQPTCQCAERSA
jgi:glycosyltransferase involved in cell wall biosynthesis